MILFGWDHLTSTGLVSNVKAWNNLKIWIIKTIVFVLISGFFLRDVPSCWQVNYNAKQASRWGIPFSSIQSISLWLMFMCVFQHEGRTWKLKTVSGWYEMGAGVAWSLVRSKNCVQYVSFVLIVTHFYHLRGPWLLGVENPLECIMHISSKNFQEVLLVVHAS